MDIEVNTRNMKFLECFSSHTRVRIIELLDDKPMNIKSLSEALDIKSPIVTRHVHMLEEAGIVRSETMPGKRGMQKMCFLHLSHATLLFRGNPSKEKHNRYDVSVPVGAYSHYEVKPTCGLASSTGMIGMCDDPRYFADPEHVHAKVIWFSSGYVEYRIPNYMVNNERPESLEIALELCSETPCTVSHLPSDIVFSINGREVGTWTYPGDFGGSRGLYTPEWWYKNVTYGLMKSIRITRDGSFIDGIKVSGVTIDEIELAYDKEIMFRISCSTTAKNCGGVTLFGKGFGNYNQDIEVTLRC
ncbi:ArsR family transcriptional regulator [Paenibacillus sp. GSMTC-2017]|uniref:ArsR/SmtB family transcription factor n=1 Tax=Paenibacillus sp. GSMTC-2017 TaxID=2794350 RepID=UPI0018D7B333|nr:ArsR family transcriptional regulator [Paenibacillus sp. GSMTC-2017]MBH5318266.1 ArsR family transcriptional regulator [Paenibacillus sp. GSMTC-2017]